MQTEGHAMTRKQSIYSSLELCKSSSFLLLYLFSPLSFNTASFCRINHYITKILFYQKWLDTKERLNVCLTARTITQRWGNPFHCMAENPLPLPIFQLRLKHILSATSAQIFRYLWFMPSLGVRSLCLTENVIPLKLCMKYFMV